MLQFEISSARIRHGLPSGMITDFDPGVCMMLANIASLSPGRSLLVSVIVFYKVAGLTFEFRDCFANLPVSDKLGHLRANPGS